MRTNLRKILFFVGTIWTVIVLFIVYKNIEFPFAFQFVIGWLVFLLLLFIKFIISAFFYIKKLKGSIIRKILFRFIISSFVIWGLTVLFIYITKGELRMTDKIISSIAISFGSTIGSLAFEKKNNAY